MADKPNVAYHHPDYDDMVNTWRKLQDCFGGSAAMKAHDLDADKTEGSTYILRPNPDDTTEENQKRFEQYVRRSVWYPVTSRTRKGMLGQAFLKPPVLNLPAELEPLRANVDGTGVTLEQQARMALGYVLGYGRCGILADYPPLSEPASRSDVLAGVARPTISLYDPSAIINWRTTVIGAETVLSLLVLAESAVVADDDYQQSTEVRYRELRLIEGRYTVRLWKEAKNGLEAISEIVPRDASQRTFNRIPFQMIGADSNTVEIDDSPMLDLAELNIAHWRNSADYEESSYMCGQATPWASGLDEDWVKTVLKGTIRLGSRGGIPLPKGAVVGLLQAQPNGMVKEAMDTKERQMVALGAKLLQPVDVQRTATEARLESASEVSVLGGCANNVASAYVNALAWAGKFAATKEPSVFEIDADAELRRMSPEELRELVVTWQSKGITISELRDKLRRGGVATLDLDDYKAEVDSEVDYGTAGLPSVGAGAGGNEQ